jgi:hypothetical protein
VRADGEEVLQLAHLVDADLTACALALALSGLDFSSAGLGQGFGLEDAEIGMVALPEPEAGRARTARKVAAGRTFAQEPPGEERCQDRLAEPGPAMDEQRMGQVRPPGLEPLPRWD